MFLEDEENLQNTVQKDEAGQMAHADKEIQKTQTVVLRQAVSKLSLKSYQHGQQRKLLQSQTVLWLKRSKNLQEQCGRIS